MALRLPDIPVESWISDQQDRLGRLTESAFPSLEFRAAALDQESQIPAYANEEQLAEEERRRLAEEQRRAQEAEALRAQQQAELERQQQAEMAQQQQAQAEQQRQQGFMDQAWQMAREAGIPTPGDAYDYFTDSHSRPSVGGDAESSAGTFDPASTVPDAATGQSIPYTDPAQVRSSDDFMAATAGLNDSVFGPIQQGVEEAGRFLQPAAERIKRAGTGIFDAAQEPQNAIDTVEAAGTRAFDTLQESVDPIASSGLNDPPPSNIVEAVIAGNKRMNLVKDPTSRNVAAITAAIDAGGDEVGRRVGRAMGVSDQALFEVFGIPVSGEDIAGVIGSVVLDPTNVLGAGPAREAAEIAARGAAKTLRQGAVRETLERGGRWLGEQGTRLAEGISTSAPELAPAMGAIPARQIGDLAPSGGRRMYHGTGDEWASPNPNKFDPNGLFGPGYYLTSDPRVAADYATTRSRGPNPSGWNFTENEADIPPIGANIRPVDLDNRMTFYHADRPVPQTDVRRIATALHRVVDDESLLPNLQDYDSLAMLPPQEYRALAQKPDSPIQGERFYNNLGRDFLSADEAENRFTIDIVGDRDADINPDKEFVNRVLHEAGFDGVYYGGGQRIPITDETGKAIQHQAVVVFPERLDRLRNALSGEVRGARAVETTAPPRAFEVYEPRTGDVVRTFDTDAEAATHAERLTNETGQFHDYAEASGGTYTPLDRFEQGAGQMRERVSGKFADRARELLPLHTLTGSGVGAVTGGPVGAAVGWNEAPEDAPLSEKFERAKVGFLAGALVGGGVGGSAALVSNLAGTKLIQRGLRTGAIDAEVLSTHPSLQNRYKAMMLLAARDKADDEIVQAPGMVQYLSRVEKNAIDAQTAQRIQETGEMTAGEIRQAFSTSKVEDIGRAATALVTDTLRGESLRHSRGREAGADAASVLNRTPEPPRTDATTFSGMRDQRLSDISEAATPLPSGDIVEAARETAKAFGIPQPLVYVVEEPTINAYGVPGSGAAPGIVVTRGLLDANLTWDEATSVMAHELAHATDAEKGRSLLESAEQATQRLSRRFENRADTAIERLRGKEPDLEISDDIGRPEYYDRLGDDLPEMMGSNDLTPGAPRRGPWAERVKNGPQIPEGVSAPQAKNIERAFNEATRLLNTSQGKRRANDQMRFRRLAEEAWAKYEDLRAQGSTARGGVKGGGLEGPVQPDVPAPGRVSTRSEPGSGGGDRPGDENLFGDTASPSAVGGPDRLSPEAVKFEPAPLPEYAEFLHRRRTVPIDEAARVMRQIQTEVAADPNLSKDIQTLAGRLLTRDKITGRNLEELLDYVAKKRGVPRGKTPEQAAIDWTEDFLQKNGWVAPSRRGETLVEEAARAVPEAPAGAEGVTGTTTADVAGKGAADVAQNLQGGVAGLGLGAASTDEDDDTETSLEHLAAGAVLGVIGRRNPRKIFQNPATAPFATSARRRAFLSPTGPVKPDFNFLERVQNWGKTRFTDDLAMLKDYENFLSKEWQRQMGTVLPSSVMAAQLKRLDAGYPANIMIQNYFKPHLQAIDKLGVPEDVLNTYLANVQDIAISNATGNPGRMFPGGSNVTDAIRDNQDFLNQLRADTTPAQFQQFEQAVDGIWDFGRRILEVKRDAGLINDESFQAMRKRFPNYVPTRILDYLDSDDHVKFGKSMSVNSDTIHAITEAGTTREAATPTSALYAAAFEAQAAARKNTVFNAFLGMTSAATMLPTTSGMRTDVTKESQRLANFAFGRGIVPLTSTSAKLPDGMTAIKGFIDGQKVAFGVDEALGDITKFAAPVNVPFFSGLMHAFRAAYTAREPTFLVRNTVGDLSSYMVRETSRGGATPKAAAEAFAVWAQTLGEFVLSPGAWPWILRGEHRGDEARFLESGGGNAGVVQQSMRQPSPTHINNIDRVARLLGFQGHSPAEVGVHNLIRRSPFDIRRPSDFSQLMFDTVTLKFIEAAGARIENVPRVAAMRLAERRQVRAGLPPNQLQATGAGRTTTLDFGVGGSWSKTINQMVPFFNVGTQAMVDPWRAYKENPKAFTATALTMVGGSMALAEAWNQASDSRRDAYNDVPDYLKDRGVIIMFPHGEETYPGSGVRYPEAPVDEKGNPHPQAIFFPWRQYSPIAQMARRTLNEWIPQWRETGVPEAERRTLLEAVQSGVGSMSPISANDSLDLFTSLTPLGVQTALQVGNDWDTFRGARIKSAYADKRATPFSHALSDATGGYLTPAQSEFASRDVGGGYAKILHGASEILYGKGEGKDDTIRTPQDIPGAGGFIQGFVKGSIGGNAERAREHAVTPSTEKILSANGVRWRPSPADPEIENIPLTRAEYAAYQREVNKVTDEVVRRITSDPSFKNMNAVDKEAMLQRELNRERGYARQDVLATIPRDEIERRYQKRIDAGEIATPIRTRKTKRR